MFIQGAFNQRYAIFYCVLLLLFFLFLVFTFAMKNLLYNQLLLYFILCVINYLLWREYKQLRVKILNCLRFLLLLVLIVFKKKEKIQVEKWKSCSFNNQTTFQTISYLTPYHSPASFCQWKIHCDLSFLYFFHRFLFAAFFIIITLNFCFTIE